MTNFSTRLGLSSQNVWTYFYRLHDMVAEVLVQHLARRPRREPEIA